MAKVFDKITPDVLKKHPNLNRDKEKKFGDVTVDDLNTLKVALVESSAQPGAPACQTCCCCCAAAVGP